MAYQDPTFPCQNRTWTFPALLSMRARWAVAVSWSQCPLCSVERGHHLSQQRSYICFLVSLVHHQKYCRLCSDWSSGFLVDPKSCVVRDLSPCVLPGLISCLFPGLISCVFPDLWSCFFVAVTSWLLHDTSSYLFVVLGSWMFVDQHSCFLVDLPSCVLLYMSVCLFVDGIVLLIHGLAFL